MKIGANHIQEFKSALCYAENECKQINALICYHAASDRIEMNRMIVANNNKYLSYSELFDKLLAKFESQLENDNVVEPFTESEILLAEQLINEYVKHKDAELNKIISLSNNNTVLFSVRAHIGSAKCVFDDIKEIIKNYGK